MLSELHVKWFQVREIDPETLVKLGIHTGVKTADGVKPDVRGNILVFPYKDLGVVAYRKFRGPQKTFWSDVGGRRTFFNADVMDDPALESGQQSLIICEGEIDTASCIQSGFPFAVSVPDGAPGVPKDKGPEDLDPLDHESESSGKFEFMFNNRDRLKRIKRFIIATDADGPGRRLAAELVRRLSPARCSFITYPPAPVVPVDGGKPRPCKDLNEVLMYLGQERVVQILNAAKAYPVRGLYRLSEYPDISQVETFDTGFDHWDRALRVYQGEFMVVTGVPSHGKSTFVLNLIYNLRRLHGWKAAICSPEMPTVPFLRDRFRRLFLDRRPGELELSEIAAADAFIESSLTFIDTDPTGIGETDEPFDLDWIIERATDAVLRDGIRVLVVDPWNEIEHARERGESAPDYIGRGIRSLKRFGRLYGVMVIVVAHPTKDVFRDGKLRTATLYDIEGCYSDDTEVLTKRGWLHHAQITMADEIACFDPVTDQMRYCEPSRIIRREHDGEMIRFKGYGYDLLVTPDHRMVVKPKWPRRERESAMGRPERWKPGEWRFIEAGALPSAAFALPLAPVPMEKDYEDQKTVQIGSKTYPALPFWRLVGWFIAEGHVGPTGLTWSQAAGEVAEAFSEGFADAGIPASVGWQEPHGKGRLVTGRWYIGNKFCPDLIRWFSDNCGRGAAKKQIPEAAFLLPTHLKAALLDAYLEGDGSKSRAAHSATTISRQLCDDLLRLGLELGRHVSCISRKSENLRHADRFILRFGTPGRREVAVRGTRNVSREKYDGFVWCLTVPTGAYFVRRNGAVSVSGNSSQWFNKADHGIVIERNQQEETFAHIQKVRFDETGKRGSYRMLFLSDTGKFMTIAES